VKELAAALSLPRTNGKKTILVTGHRRESFGRGFEQICHALAEVAAQNQDVQVVYPVHLNPNVSEPVNRILGPC
jgi:UDP-N-acetylglucosamine 2-epimerase (non-hydrolysing)